MEYAAQRYTSPSRRSLLAPLVALLVGAGIAVGGYALFDDEATVQTADKVVFVDTPGPGEGVRGLDDMTTGSATIARPEVVVPYMSHGLGTQSGEVKHEGSTAAAIGAGASSQSGGVKDEASVAAAIGAGMTAQDTAIATDPHATAVQLHQR
jgi:hypothetical protein